MIEAVFEDPKVKAEVLPRIRAAAPAAIIATNTSTLPITGLSHAVADPARIPRVRNGGEHLGQRRTGQARDGGRWHGGVGLQCRGLCEISIVTASPTLAREQHTPRPSPAPWQTRWSMS